MNSKQFYQPSDEEIKDQNMSRILGMLKKQEDGISALLQKYQGAGKQDLDNYFSNKHQKQSSMLESNVKEQSKSLRKNKSLSKSRQTDKYMLPEIGSLAKKQIGVTTDRKVKKTFDTVDHQPKTALRKQLQKIYSDKKSMGRKSKDMTKLNRKKSAQRSRVISDDYSLSEQSADQPKPKFKTKISSSTSPQLINQSASNLNTQGTNLGIPQPLSHTKIIEQNLQRESEASDSDNEDIPLSSYEREFKQKMSGQCIEEINYLYFSKNESIKDWSETLLGMFEKHDKELFTLRKKMKYLQKFDDHFFAVDVYKL